MPIYEYTCEPCRSSFELLVRGGEQPECPTCRGTSLEKQLSVPAAHVAAGQNLPVMPPPCGMGGCGRPECEI